MPKVVLRAIRSEDMDTLFGQLVDSVANEMAVFGSKDPLNKPAFLERWQRILSSDEFFCRAIVFNGQFVGHVAHFEQLGNPSISYRLGREFWGRGITTRAVNQFLSLIEMRPLFARAALSNLGSIKVLENNGFKRIATENSYSEAIENMVEEAIYSLEH